jgi:methylmalonyl-CoA/ethylmalonyl-CoA epimerase
MVIDHIGVVVKSLDVGVAQWTTRFGYRPCTEPVTNTRQRVRVVFLEKSGSPLVKLIEAVDEDSPVYRFGVRGGGLHHLCFRCDDLKSGVDRLCAEGAVLLTPPEPGEAFGNEDIAFVFAGNGLNIELIATETKARRLP